MRVEIRGPSIKANFVGAIVVPNLDVVLLMMDILHILFLSSGSNQSTSTGSSLDN